MTMVFLRPQHAARALAVLATGVLLTSAAPAAPEPVVGASDVHVLRLPEGSFVPDVAMDSAGTLHLVYALNRNAYYVRSSDNGATLSAPVQVNSSTAVEFRMGERGPRLAIGRNGIVHVVWQVCWSPGVESFARYSRSVDGGKTFEPELALSSMQGIDGATVAADQGGHVLAFWRAAGPPPSDTPQATWLYVTRSADDGATFTPDEQLRVGGQPELACACCMMRARIGRDGQAYLAYRRAAANLRDLYVLKGSPTANAFAVVRVNQDNWITGNCPVCGPELAFTPDGRLLCAFMSRNRAFWAISDREVSQFQLHVPTPTGEPSELYPMAVANRAGHVLLVWQVGPLSTNGQATVKWAKYDLTGRFLGEQGVVGRSTSGTKPTAFVGTDDQFYIVTTAR